MRLRRITEQETVQIPGPADKLINGAREPMPSNVESPGLMPEVHEIIGAGMRPKGMAESSETPLAAERLDEIAFRYYGDVSLWRLIAGFNDVLDPLRMAAGQLIELPQLSELEESL